MIVGGYKVPPRVLNAFERRLKREPATAGILEDLAEAAGVPGFRQMRVVDRWLQRQRRAGRIRFEKREWHWGSQADGGSEHGD